MGSRDRLLTGTEFQGKVLILAFPALVSFLLGSRDSPEAGAGAGPGAPGRRWEQSSPTCPVLTRGVGAPCSSAQLSCALTTHTSQRRNFKTTTHACALLQRAVGPAAAAGAPSPRTRGPRTRADRSRGGFSRRTVQSVLLAKVASTRSQPRRPAGSLRLGSGSPFPGSSGTQGLVVEVRGCS